MKKYRLVNAENGAEIWSGEKCPLTWKLTLEGDGKDVTLHATPYEAVDAIIMALGKKSRIILEEEWGYRYDKQN